MQTMIEGYTIYPGEHCGSASMRGLLHHYCGLELPEPAVFGLGAGLDTGYMDVETMDPKITVFGRTGTFESDLGRHLQIDYREQPEDDDARAWEVVREEVLAGRPTMLSGDILYLDYREYKVHFPGHRFVLLGFDDAVEKAFIADRIRDVPEACSYGALIESRNPPEGLSTHNLWGKFHGTEVGAELAAAARSALKQCTEHMLSGGVFTGESSGGSFSSTEGTFAVGVAAAHYFAETLPEWEKREDAQWLASFNARCLEKFGNGGGNFRRLYAGFLAWARELDEKLVPASAPVLATQAADAWTAVSQALGNASREEGTSKDWADAARHAHRVAELEQTLFETLAERVA